MGKTIDNALSVGNKPQIAGWGMPNMAVKTVLQSGTIYQAETNGWIVMYASPGWNGNAQIKVGEKSDLSDGLDMFVTGGGYYDSESERGGGTVPVAKGNYYRANGAGFQWALFIPCLGE